MSVSCRTISPIAGGVAACRLSLQGWAVSCPPRSSHVVRCQGAARCSAWLLCRPSVLPVSISLSPPPPFSPLRPPGARPNTSSVNLTPDVHGIVGGKLPGHSILAQKVNVVFLGCTQIQVWHNEKIRIHRKLTCRGFNDGTGWYFLFCSECDRWRWSCPSTCPSQCNAFPLIMCLSEPSPPPVWGVTTSIRTFTHLPCNSWPCWCLPDRKALIVVNLSENFLPDTTCLASQFSDTQNLLDWNQMNRRLFVDKVINKKKIKGVSACESKAAIHWESGSILGTILANASVPMIPQCCYGKLPSASLHLWRTAAVYPQLPTALPIALPR